VGVPLCHHRSLVHYDWIYRLPATDLLSSLDTGTVGMVVVHPPAGFSLTYTTDPSTTTTDEQIAAFHPVAKEASRVLRAGGVAVAMGDARALGAWEVAAGWAGLSYLGDLTVVWDRPFSRRPHAVANLPSLSMGIRRYVKPGWRAAFNPQSARQAMSNVLVCEQVPDIDRVSPSQLPVQLFVYLVSMFTESNDYVVDPFCGAGGSLVAAEMLDRRWVGGDVDLAMVAESRLRVGAVEVERVGDIGYWYDGAVHRIEGD